MIYQLNNQIKYFPWGSYTALTQRFGISNINSLPQAEVWMGAHVNGSSTIEIEGQERQLIDVISGDLHTWLGPRVDEFTKQLPFLVKLLAAEQPLSIQVHPSKKSAQQGFFREEQLGLDKGSPKRNYKDANHKPELIYALTPYLALNGFREFDIIQRFFDTLSLPSLSAIISPYLAEPTAETLKIIFKNILLLDETKKTLAIAELIDIDIGSLVDQELKAAITLSKYFYTLYPSDIGLFAPLFLNVIELKQGEAMFIFAETPHAYLKGVGVEVMANSDNVLRAGLTPKHIDVAELIANTNFSPIPYGNLRMPSTSINERDIYPIPVDDFKFEIIKGGVFDILVESPEILLCLDGTLELQQQGKMIRLQKGDSAIVATMAKQYQLNCAGVAARTYC